MKKKQVYLVSCLTLLALAFTQTGLGFADDGSLTDLIKSMQKQMSNMQKTIESQNQKISAMENREVPAVSAAAPAGSTIIPPMSDADFKDKLDTYMGGKDSSKWLSDLKFSGDLRLRYEPAHFHSGNSAASGDLNRFRFRLRYGFEKKFNPDMKVGFRLASGSTTDPASTNQTLTGNFVDKTHAIDRAYAIYTPSWAAGKGPVKALEIGGGKFINPFVRGTTDMIWDDDVNPEGAYEMVDYNIIDGETFGLNGWATLGQMILTQNAHGAGVDNSELYAFQGGLTPEIKIGDMPLKFTNSLSYYNYADYGNDSNFGALAGGNPNVDGAATTLDAQHFRVLEVYNSVDFKPLAALPSMKLYLDWARNVAEKAPEASANGEDMAWALGYKIGKAKEKGTWELGYAYKYIEANSTVGAFNDSDFGHSGRKGSVFSAKYAITDALQTGVTGFLLNNLNHDTLARDQEEVRFLCDLVWSF